MKKVIKVSSLRDIVIISIIIICGVLLFIDLYNKGLLLS